MAEAETITRVGFAGLGRMGRLIARNVLEAGYELVVYNRSSEPCDELRELGAVVADSPRSLAEQVDAAMSSLADDAAVRDVYLGDRGLIAGTHPGQLLLEMSTISPSLVRELAREAESAGARFLEAPVSGSLPAAEAATLVIMAAGPQSTFESAIGVLSAVSSERYHLGPTGAGSAMKLAVNNMVAATNLALSESLVMAERSGIERAAAYRVIQDSVVGSRYVDYKRSAFLAPDEEPVYMTTRLFQKDVTLALQLGRDLGLPLLSTAAVNEALNIAIGLGHGDGDLSRMADALRLIASRPADDKETV